MKDFVSKLVTQIVDNPQDVTVNEVEDSSGKLLQLSVAPADMGKTIGKSGRIIKALRDLVRVRAIKSGEKVSLQLLEG